jgi:hypothetical protein
MPKIQRLTLFKIPDPSDVDKAIEAYKKVGTDNQKVRSRQAHRQTPIPCPDYDMSRMASHTL